MTEFADHHESSNLHVTNIINECKSHEDIYKANGSELGVDIWGNDYTNRKRWTVWYDPGEYNVQAQIRIYRANLHAREKLVEYVINVSNKEVTKQDRSKDPLRENPTNQFQPVTEPAEIGLLLAIVTTVHKVNLGAE